MPRSDRGFEPSLPRLLLVLLGIKAFTFLAGAWFASTASLDRASYLSEYHHARPLERFTSGKARFFELWVPADAQWYAWIAERGYPRREELTREGCLERPRLIERCDNRLAWVFFPGWPLAIRAFRLLLPDVFAAGFVASNLFSLAAALLLFRLVRSRCGGEDAFWGTALLFASPFALFYDVPFSEGLFLLLAVAGTLAAEARRFAAAGLLIGLAAVTRPTGAFLLLVPLTLVFNDARERRRPPPLRASGLLLAGLPIAAWLLHNRMRTGSWTYFREAIAAWGYAPGEPLQNLARNTVGALLAFPRLEAHAFHSSKVDVLVMVVMIAALFASTARLPAHWSVYLGTTVLVPLLSKDLMSYGRYAVAAWPAFVLPALVVRGRHRRWALPLLLALFLAGRLLLVRRLVAWEWVG